MIHPLIQKALDNIEGMATRTVIDALIIRERKQLEKEPIEHNPYSTGTMYTVEALEQLRSRLDEIYRKAWSD